MCLTPSLCSSKRYRKFKLTPVGKERSIFDKKSFPGNFASIKALPSTETETTIIQQSL